MDDKQHPSAFVGLWPLIQALERAAWHRRWAAVRKARKELERVVGPRPRDPLFDDKKEEG
jgi:hypothetical protein